MSFFDLVSDLAIGSSLAVTVAAIVVYRLTRSETFLKCRKKMSSVALLLAYPMLIIVDIFLRVEGIVGWTAGIVPLIQLLSSLILL